MQPTVIVAIARTPGQDRPAPERVIAQRSSARGALAVAARRAGCPDKAFEKSSPRGKPVPTAAGWRWSISHDATFVAGTVHPTCDIGVDLELIALRRRMLVERVANEAERRLLGESEATGGAIDALGFARLWTAKEAVLKAEGVGIAGLSACRLTGLFGPSVTELTYRGEPRLVQHTRIEDHLVSYCRKGATETDPIAWLCPPPQHTSDPAYATGSRLRIPLSATRA